MGTIVTLIAGFVLAGAATVGVVTTSGGGPSGTAPPASSEVTAVYDAGQ